MDDNNIIKSKNKNTEDDLLEIKVWGQKLRVNPPELSKQSWKKYNSNQLLKNLKKTAPWWGIAAALLIGIYLGRTSHQWAEQGIRNQAEQNYHQDETFESVYSNY